MQLLAKDQFAEVEVKRDDQSLGRFRALYHAMVRSTGRDFQNLLHIMTGFLQRQHDDTRDILICKDAHIC